jgi:hypothetical protein
MPIMPTSRPRTAIASTRTIEPELMKASTSRPSIKSAVYSGGPKRSAKAASGGAIAVSTTTLTVPATNEAMVVRNRAGPARPRRVIS